MSHQLFEALEDRTLTVLEYLDLVNELVSPLKVSVEGEITDLKILRDWVFFSLKDAESGALLRCGLHAQQYRRLGVNVEEGMQVKVAGYGKISPKTGNFGFWVSEIEPVGEGALRRAYELLVRKLTEEGLFARKRDLPDFISHIGVISSRNGVVLQDLRKNLSPLGIRIDFIHSGVEGADSAKEILRAVEQFSAASNKPDVLVLIRGGGSLESLQGFNNEAVARALFAAPMPVLVGIGHDVDVPIATMVADWSASTPTAVAHVINSSWAPLSEDVPGLWTRMAHLFQARYERVHHATALAQRSMQGVVKSVLARFERLSAAVVECARVARTRATQAAADATVQSTQLVERYRRGLTRASERVTALERVILASDPTRTLTRGYSLVYHNGRLVRSVTQVQVDEGLSVRLEDGTLETRVTNKIAT